MLSSGELVPTQRACESRAGYGRVQADALAVVLERRAPHDPLKLLGTGRPERRNQAQGLDCAHSMACFQRRAGIRGCAH